MAADATEFAQVQARFCRFGDSITTQVDTHLLPSTSIFIHYNIMMLLIKSKLCFVRIISNLCRTLILCTPALTDAGTRRQLSKVVVGYASS